MLITAKFAQSIVDEIGFLTNKNINFFSGEGVIIASKDKNRIGSIHEGALEVIKTKESVIIKDNSVLKGARPGINLPVFLNDQIVGVIGITGKEEDVKPLGEVIKKMTEILVKEAFLEKQIDLERRAKFTFIDEWLNGKIKDEGLFVTRGSMYGIDVFLPRIVVILDPTNINQLFYKNKGNSHINVNEELNLQSLKHKIVQSVEAFFNSENQVVVYMSGDGKYVILYPINVEAKLSTQQKIISEKINLVIKKIKDTFSVELSAGVGRYHPEVGGVVKSYYEAKRALEVAKKRQRILFYEQLSLELILDEISPKTKSELIERVFPKDIDEKEIEKFIETLDIFFYSNQSLEKTSKELYIHKNTLQYRLKRIKELTGFDPRKFLDALMLYIAITFLKK